MSRCPSSAWRWVWSLLPETPPCRVSPRGAPVCVGEIVCGVSRRRALVRSYERASWGLLAPRPVAAGPHGPPCVPAGQERVVSDPVPGLRARLCGSLQAAFGGQGTGGDCAEAQRCGGSGRLARRLWALVVLGLSSGAGRSPWLHCTAEPGADRHPRSCALSPHAPGEPQVQPLTSQGWTRGRHPGNTRWLIAGSRGLAPPGLLSPPACTAAPAPRQLPTALAAPGD